MFIDGYEIAEGLYSHVKKGACDSLFKKRLLEQKKKLSRIIGQRVKENAPCKFSVCDIWRKNVNYD